MDLEKAVELVAALFATVYLVFLRQDSLVEHILLLLLLATMLASKIMLRRI